MTVNSSIFEKVSFWELLGRHAIEIPIIQRDYAQGRESQQAIRQRFLSALHSAITVKPIELDFIFGNVHGGAFQPLDGQQRLTTLFLLHWYAACRSGWDASVYREQLAKFSYETRSSSKAFCHGLVLEEFEVDFTASNVSESIKDCPWYFAAWQHDPTVSGMLRMADDIHEKFRGVEHLWEQLTVPEGCPIVFYSITVERCGLSDDLYIKMNARGKPLTAFENFKALLEQRITESGWDFERSLRENFATKVDNIWTDAFWDLAMKGDDGERYIDGPMLNFCRQVAVCAVAGGELPATSRERRIRELLVEGRELGADDFNQADYESLHAGLDVVAQKQLVTSGIKMNCFGLVRSLDTILDEVTQGADAFYKKRVLLQAQIRFFAHGGSLDSAYLDWMRVVRNIVQQATVDSPESFMGAIRLIDELSRGTREIYSYLARTTVDSSFARVQVNEEVWKALIIRKHPEQKALLHDLEDLAFCEGRIGFALYCVEGDPSAIDLDFERLSKVRDVIKRDLSMAVTTELRRALFTVGDGRFYHYWRSYLYAVNAPKFCTIKDAEDLRKYAYNQDFRHYLKGLVFKLSAVATVADLLRSFKPSGGTPNWMIRIIAEPGLMEASKHGYLTVSEDDLVCYLIPRTRVAASDKGVKQLVEVK